MNKLDPKTTLVLVVDVQERLARVMPEARMDAVLRAGKILLGAAHELGAPVLVSQQYPQGLGTTLPELVGPLELAQARRCDKTQFSVVGAQELGELQQQRAIESVVVMGMETHVCVFQTVRDLRAQGLETYVVTDGVCSRQDDHRQVGLDLCVACGAQLTTAETVVFDWLGSAQHPAFKAISKLVR